MPTKGSPTPEDRDRAVEMYQAGRKAEEIAAETGVVKSSLYYELRQRGILPNRQRTASSLTEAMERLEEAHRTIGRLEAENERLRGQVEFLREQLDGR